MAKPFQVLRRSLADHAQALDCSIDILWGRPVFRAPPLANPRIVFDPLPFRNFLHPERRPTGAAAGRNLNAA